MEVDSYHYCRLKLIKCRPILILDLRFLKSFFNLKINKHEKSVINKIKPNLKLANGLPPMKRLFIVFSLTFWRFSAIIEVIEYLLGKSFNIFFGHLELSTNKSFYGFFSSGFVFFMSLDNGMSVIHLQLQFFHTFS